MRRGREERRGEPGLEVDCYSLHCGWRPVWKKSCDENIVCKPSMKNGQVRCGAVAIIASEASGLVYIYIVLIGSTLANSLQTLTLFCN